MTARAIREDLLAHQGYTDEEGPRETTIGKMLNRLDSRLKRIQKTKPLKKTPRRI